MTRVLPYPEDGERVETGPVKFGDDWKGLYIRGDDCLAFKIELQRFIDSAKKDTLFDQLKLQETMYIIELINEVLTVTNEDLI